MNRLLIATAALVLAAPALPSAAFAQSDADFAKEAIRGDNSEIMLGTYASQHASNPQVRKFGETLAKDHVDARDQIRKVAPSLQDFPAQGPKAHAQSEQNKLSKLSGAAFDEEFLNYMIDDHKHDIADFTEKASAKDQTPVSKVAAQQLPTLKKHLKMAEELKSRLASK